MLTVFSIIISLALLYFAVPWLYCQANCNVLRFRSRRRRAIAITFDDGPGATVTPEILKILNEHNAKATFFVLGTNVPGNESILREIASSGHLIASHGYSHLNHWKVMPQKAIADINQGWKAIDTALNRNAGRYAFRPPYGKLNIFTLLYLLVKRVPIIMWSFDICDTRPGPDGMPPALKPGIIRGDVLVAHDYERKNAAFRARLMNSIRSILQEAQNNKIAVIRITDL
jgi:peptidoglycan/xylan/chitin deacetylase (PgdA/CDA1 family)